MTISEVCKRSWPPFPKISKKLSGYILLSYFLVITYDAFPDTHNHPVYSVTNPFNADQIAYLRQLPARYQILIEGEGYDVEILNITEVLIEEDSISFVYQNQQYNVQIIHNHQIPFRIMNMNQTQQYFQPQPLVVNKVVGCSYRQ